MSVEFEKAMAETLADAQLSRSERRALAELLEEDDPGAGKLAYYRNRAFDLAREAIGPGEAATVLGWLERVVKLLVPQVDTPAAAAASEAYFSPADDCPTRIGRLFRDARESADVCVFTITDNRISHEIVAAHRRGVKVRVITDDEKSEDRGSDIDDLLRAGVEVRFDSSPYHMHHKFGIFDRALLLTGSYNWTRGAAEQNEENFIVTGDRGLVRDFGRTFDKLWAQFE